MRLATQQDALALEALVDSIGMTEVLNLLAAISAEKAEHLLTNWQDKATARQWESVGAKLSATADSVDARLGSLPRSRT